MSDGPKPDPIVREPEARASVDELSKGLAEDARHNGVMPPMREIEKFAQEVTREQIARHEERFRNGVPEKRGGKAEGVATIDRGTFTDDFGTVEKVVRAFDPARHAAKTKALASVADSLEARLADMRLAMLLAWKTTDGKIVRQRHDASDVECFPEWAARIRKTWEETLRLSRNLTLNTAEANSNAADAVLKLLDESSATFGDWRHPKGPDGQPLYFIAQVTHGE